MRVNSSNVTAITLVLIGVAFLLDNLGLFGGFRVSSFFPLLFTLYGAVWLTSCKRRDHFVWPAVLMVGGVLATLANLDILRISWHQLWPLALIGAGVSMLLGRTWRADFKDRLRSDINFGSGSRSTSFSATLDENAVFGEVKRAITSQEFTGGQIKASFGSVNIDLRKAGIAPGKEAIIDCNASFGGIEIKIPESWRLEWRGTAVFGGFSDKTLPPRPEPGVTPPLLIITGTAAFGGIEVRN